MSTYSLLIPALIFQFQYQDPLYSNATSLFFGSVGQVDYKLQFVNILDIKACINVQLRHQTLHLFNNP